MSAGREERVGWRLTPKPPGTNNDWSTTDCCAEALTRFVLPPLLPGRIWECAPSPNQDDFLGDAMRAAGREVVTTYTDFLTTAVPAGVRLLATNPPFDAMSKFIERALFLLDAGALDAVVFLFRSDHTYAESDDLPRIRLAALNRSAAQFFCAWRPRWVRGSKGNGHFSAAWIVWLRPGVAGPHGPVWLRRRRDGRIEVAV
jgi:hypothetical protein